MKLPDFITHYYEEDYGPFLNICDLDDEQIGLLTSAEKDAKTAFNRFAIGPDFFRWRRAADDLLIRAYTEKFGFPPPARPFYALLGSFDKTLTMFRNGSKIRLDVDAFQDHELTFMYPDPVSRLQRARKFYEEVLRFPVPTAIDGNLDSDMGMLEYEIGPHTLAITTAWTDGKPPEQPSAGLVLEVEDFDEAIEHIGVRGIGFDLGPFEGPGCSIAVISDPDGNTIGIHKRN